MQEPSVCSWVWKAHLCILYLSFDQDVGQRNTEELAFAVFISREITFIFVW